MSDRFSAPDRIIASRSSIASFAAPLRKTEAEGGCGVIGLAASVPIEGRHLLPPLLQMTNRGNGKGGGIAAVGLSPSQMGVSQEILDHDYLILLAYLDADSRRAVEEKYLSSCFELHQAQKIPTVADYHKIPGLEVRPPEVWRYFGRVKPEILSGFTRQRGLSGLEPGKIEDEFVYQNSFQLNREFYATGERRAFVLSHGRNLYVIKIVGYAQDVIRYYRLEELQAHVWIGHQRYPTKGKVWHPGGSHPFVGLDEALVHNGDFANYHSITEYLAQRNIAPLFLTDTEVSVLLFDLLNRVYDYPLEYLIEALAPTTERDFEMLPEEKKQVYRRIQSAHVHGSPDGPWFFIIALNDKKSGSHQLLGITDTSMLRPQVFALQEGEVQIGLIASEKQAIDAALQSLERSDKRFWAFADRYWNARGGSYTDGGAFVFSVKSGTGGKVLTCTDKFGRSITTPQKEKPNVGLQTSASTDGDVFGLEKAKPSGARQHFLKVRKHLAGLSYAEFSSGCQRAIGLGQKDETVLPFVIQFLTLLVDRPCALGGKKQSYVRKLLEEALFKVLDGISSSSSSGVLEYRRLDFAGRSRLRSPGPKETTLVVDAAGFPPEGTGSLSSVLVEAVELGWRKFIVYRTSGQRFVGCGLGPQTEPIEIDVYGSPGDYLASGLDGALVRVHASGQDQLANIMKSGRLIVFGDVGQTFMYGAKGGEVFVLGNAAGRPLINATGRPRVVINGTCLDYLAESFMAGDPLSGGGFVILNGVRYDEDGRLTELEVPYAGGNLFSLASGGAIYVRDPRGKLSEDQLNGGRFSALTQKDWELIFPYLVENENHFGLRVDELLTVDGRKLPPEKIYRKIEPVVLRALEPEEMEVARF